MATKRSAPYTYECPICRKRVVALERPPRLWCMCHPGGSEMSDVRTLDDIARVMGRIRLPRG